MRSSYLLAVSLALLAAGCIGSVDQGEPDGPSGTQTSADQPPPGGDAAEATDEFDPGWPPLAAATIRPGVGVGKAEIATEETHSCSSNFLFRSPDNSTLYLGTAAHCVDHKEIGDPMSIAQGEATAEITYAGWWDTTNESYANDHGQDFALLALPDEARGEIHPAVLAYGGPTGLADPTDLALLDEIRWYGNATWRADQGAMQENEGYVCEASDGVSPVYAHAIPTAGPGDSGSPVLDAQGRALGPLVGATTLVCPTNSYAERIPPLTAALEEARDRGVKVELVTWPRLEGSADGPATLRSL